MILINAVLCAALGYIAFAFLVAGHPPKNAREMVLHVALCGCFALFIMAAALPIARGFEPLWWTVLLRASLLAVATWLYDARFGIARHLRMLRGWAASRPAAWVAIPRRVAAWLRLHR